MAKAFLGRQIRLSSPSHQRVSDGGDALLSIHSVARGFQNITLLPHHTQVDQQTRLRYDSAALHRNINGSVSWICFTVLQSTSLIPLQSLQTRQWFFFFFKAFYRLHGTIPYGGSNSKLPLVEFLFPFRRPARRLADPSCRVGIELKWNFAVTSPRRPDRASRHKRSPSQKKSTIVSNECTTASTLLRIVAFNIHIK